MAGASWKATYSVETSLPAIMSAGTTAITEIAFDPQFYATEEGSHLYNLMDTIVGDAGVGGWLKQIWLQRMGGDIDGLFFSDLENTFIPMFNLPRAKTETYKYNPKINYLDYPSWKEIAIKDSAYRQRMSLLFKGLNAGGTRKGFELVCEAITGQKCEIYENWNYVGSESKAEFPNNELEITVSPFKESITEREIGLMGWIFDRLKPADSSVTIKKIGVPRWRENIPHACSADSEYFEIVHQTTAYGPKFIEWCEYQKRHGKDIPLDFLTNVEQRDASWLEAVFSDGYKSAFPSDEGDQSVYHRTNRTWETEDGKIALMWGKIIPHGNMEYANELYEYTITVQKKEGDLKIVYNDNEVATFNPKEGTWQVKFTMTELEYIMCYGRMACRFEFIGNVDFEIINTELKISVFKAPDEDARWGSPFGTADGITPAFGSTQDFSHNYIKPKMVRYLEKDTEESEGIEQPINNQMYNFSIFSEWKTFDLADSPDNYPGGKAGQHPYRPPALYEDGSIYVFPYSSQKEYVERKSQTIIASGGQISNDGDHYRLLENMDAVETNMDPREAMMKEHSKAENMKMTWYSYDANSPEEG